MNRTHEDLRIWYERERVVELEREQSKGPMFWKWVAWSDLKMGETKKERKENIRERKGDVDQPTPFILSGKSTNFMLHTIVKIFSRLDET